MQTLSHDAVLGRTARLFLVVTTTVITVSAVLGAAGSLTGDRFMLQVHPYLFFIGFGNLAILLLNRYLIAAIYPQLRIDGQRQARYIYGVVASLGAITIAVAMEWPLLKALTGLFLMGIVVGPMLDIFTTLSPGKIWKEVSVRYYIFDVIFLLNANLGLFTLGLREAFPEQGIIPFFVTQSAYFLGSSFPLSISVMGFLYTYAWKYTPKGELMRTLFSLWFYIFVGGVLFFLVVILMGDYLSMMLISHLLTFGVMALLGGFAYYLHNFFRTRFHHPALGFLLAGLSLLFATSAFGIMNIYYIKGIPFGSHPPIQPDKMWIYHSHTHSALLGWITFSFIGMIYVVIPSIIRNGSLEHLRGGKALFRKLNERTMHAAFGQLTLMFISAVAALLAFYLENLILLGIAGLIFALGVFFLMVNLRSELASPPNENGIEP